MRLEIIIISDMARIFVPKWNKDGSPGQRRQFCH